MTKKRERDDANMTYDEWWNDYLKKIEDKEWMKKMNEFMLKQMQSLPPPPSKSEIKSEDLDNVIEKKVEVKCSGCGEEFDWSNLDRNMLCEECVEKGTSNETTIKAGDPEAAFFFQNLDYNIPEYRIIRSIKYLHCPTDGYSTCRFSVDHLADVRPKIPIYRILFDHYVSQHYRLLKKEHSRFENLAYAILQEFTIYEASTKKGINRSPKITQDRKNKKALAMHNLMKHLGIPLNILALIIKSHQGAVGDMAFSGIELCTTCSKSYYSDT